MEERRLKNTPRVGSGCPVDARESHTPSNQGVCWTYTGPAQDTLKGMEAATAASGSDGASSRDGSKPVLLTAPVADILTTTDNPRHTVRSPVVQLERLQDSDLENGGSRAATPTYTSTGSGFFRRPGSGSDESGDESAASHNLDLDDSERERTRATFRRKRRGSELEDSPEKDRGAALKPSSKRGRGRPPTTGQYVGLSKTKQEYLELQQKEIQIESEKEVLEMTKRLPDLRSHRLSETSLSDCTMAEDDVVTVAKLGSAISQSLDTISAVTKKSKNLKGTSIAALKKATLTIQEAWSALLVRSTSEETRALVEANTRLTRELDYMKKELEAVKRKLADAQPQPAPISKELDVEELLQRAVREAVSVTSARLDARIEGLEARLLPEPRLRPPLAADKKRDEARNAVTPASKVKERTPEPEPTVSTLSPPLNPGPALKEKRKRIKKSAAAVEAAAARRDADPPTTAKGPNPAEQWSEVVKRGGKKQSKAEGKKVEPKNGQKKRKRKKRGGLRAPKTAAVVVTLLPDAEKRGVTYKSIMDKAKQHVDITTLDIPAVKFKQAVTGARMYEVSGTACKEKADALAGKLKEVLGEEDVRVSRPQKCAELRITGMDDSATTTEIAAAVARCGGCAAEEVKVGEIRVDRSGRGSAWVKCPVEAAKSFTAPNAKLYVGWTVVRVTLLSTRTMRCYKCHEAGHTRAKCPSEVERGDLCFRCGQPGHAVKDCGNPPHCAV
ncbi:uncharacterized protein LOC121729534 [Aricia agestis]|uniref:uncharacterized protein LOC121729534 n=1 Tax=Aricia agestis TaxID=91739 RepID=UPI001C20AEB7|nr:uncharacterized protein LOC121729534 [Aricia agestis]